MKLFFVSLTFLFSLLCGCQRNETKTFAWHSIRARDSLPLYRVKVPLHWAIVPTEPSQDTMKAIAEFLLEENGQEIRITIHNFPSFAIQDRIPPEAQTQRWLRQFDSINPSKTVTSRHSQSGFSGLQLEAEGTLHDSDQALLAWSMQLSPVLYYHVPTCSVCPPERLPHMRADFTIKASGPSDLLYSKRDEILLFAHSLELIEGIPAP